MAVDEQYIRIRRSLEEKLGVEETTFLMDRPPGGWSALVTNETLERRLETLEERVAARFAAFDGRFESIDHRFDALRYELRADFRDHTNRLVLWMVPTIFAGLAAMGGVAALIR